MTEPRQPTFQPISKRRALRIERQCTQIVHTAKRDAYRTSGYPRLAQPAIWRSFYGVTEELP
jgi:hypothetical protein